MEEKFRLFLAVNLGMTEKRELQGFTASIAHRMEPARPVWVDGEALHLSLHFFGEVTKSVKLELERDLEPFRNSYTLRDIYPTGLAYLPSPRSPRVFCAKVGFEPDSGVQSLVRDLRLLASAHHTAVDSRPWLGHITLARLKGQGAPQLSALPSLPPFCIHPTSFDLTLSELRPNGPRYTVLSRYEFSREE